MEKIAFVLGNLVVNWSAVILTLACAVTMCLFLSLYLRESENVWAAFVVVPLAMLLSLAAARLDMAGRCGNNSAGKKINAKNLYFSDNMLQY